MKKKFKKLNKLQLELEKEDNMLKRAELKQKIKKLVRENTKKPTYLDDGGDEEIKELLKQKKKLKIQALRDKKVWAPHHVEEEYYSQNFNGISDFLVSLFGN